MKLTHIKAQNYIGARSVDLDVSAPVTMLTGRNGNGKSSVLDAIRHALAGNSVRVSLKKEFRALITEGANGGYATVATSEGEFSIVLPSGKGVHFDHGALPFVLDPPRFAGLDANERRQFLFGLFNLSPDGPAVTRALKVRGCGDDKIQQIKPLLRSGFDAAEKEAQAKARDAKSAWKAITGGETWGKDKAAGWSAPKPAEMYSVEQVRTAEDLLNETDAEIAATNQKLGELRAAGKQRADAETRIADLRQKANRLPALLEKLARDQAELKDWSEKLAALPPAGSSAPKLLGCPCCGAALAADPKADGGLVEYQLPTSGPLDHDLETERKQLQDAVNLFTRSVENDHRDIAAAEAAKSQINEALEVLAGTSPGYTAATEAKLEDLKADRRACNDTLQAMCAANRVSQEADELTKKATSAHADVLAWLAIADALSPDGIPAEMLSSALGPINERLTHFSDMSEWAGVMINSDMQILAGGRPYALLSESEKWRSDAMIGAAIAALSGLRLLLLDRFDVLDAQGREDLIYWLDGMAAEGVIDSVIVAGTLKSLPAGLPDSIQPVWIENGIVGEIREVA